MFCFGKMLMKMIRNSVTELSITKLGRFALMIPYEDIMKCEKLKRIFVLTRPCYINHKASYDKLYERIVTATYNARVKNITKEYVFWKVGRYATGSMDVAFRGDLKSNQKLVCEHAQQDLKRKIDQVESK